jgi:hypothetical protein
MTHLLLIAAFTMFLVGIVLLLVGRSHDAENLGCLLVVLAFMNLLISALSMLIGW